MEHDDVSATIDIIAIFSTALPCWLRNWVNKVPLFSNTVASIQLGWILTSSGNFSSTACAIEASRNRNFPRVATAIATFVVMRCGDDEESWFVKSTTPVAQSASTALSVPRDTADGANAMSVEHMANNVTSSIASRHGYLVNNTVVLGFPAAIFCLSSHNTK